MTTTAVLITGTSSGIGRAAAEHLLRRPGLTVYATARRTETVAGLADAGARVLPLDVTDEESMRAAVKAVEEEHGHVGVLVNNAGYGEYGTVEEVPMERVRRQFETNVFGTARMAQLVLPGMRRAGYGRIVNVGSMGGRMTFPVGGYYHATKYAIEALSDALRFEAAPFGIGVVVVEPGLIRTEFGTTASATLSASSRMSSVEYATAGAPSVPAAAQESPYAALNHVANTVMVEGYANTLLSATPDKAAAIIVRAATATRPRHRYLITPAARVLVHLRRLGGSRIFDAYLRRQFAAR